MNIQDKILTVLVCMLGAIGLAIIVPDKFVHGVIFYFLLLINSKTYFKAEK